MISRLFLLVSLLAIAGCAHHPNSLRHQVDAELLARTHRNLSPAKPPSDLTIPDLVNWDDGLSESEATAIGLWNNPAYQELLADLQIARADVIEASQLMNPQVTTMLPVGPKQWEFALQVPMDLLWLRPIRVAAAQLESHRVAERLVQDGLNVMRDVRIAYIDWQFALQRAEIIAQIYELRNDAKRIADARLAAGESAELDVVAVRLEAAVGQADWQRARRDALLAQENLKFTLGLQQSDVVITSEFSPITTSDHQDVEQLVVQAVASRPDLRATKLAVVAANRRNELARRSIWNFAGILPDINGRGTSGFEAGPGFQVDVPVFHQNQGARTRACAEAEQLRRRYVNQRDRASMEVRQAHLQLEQAQLDLELWRHNIVPQATGAVQAAQDALKEDGVSLLMVLETTRQLLNARQRELESEAQLRRAIAELERSVGRRLSNYTGELVAEAALLPNSDPLQMR